MGPEPMDLLDRPAECLELVPAPTSPVRATRLLAGGEEEIAAAVIDSLAAGRGPSSPPLEAEGLAFYHARVGDTDGALAWIGRSLDEFPFSYAATLWPTALWERIPADDRERLGAAVEGMRITARERVLEAQRAVQLR